MNSKSLLDSILEKISVYFSREKEKKKQEQEKQAIINKLQDQLKENKRIIWTKKGDNPFAVTKIRILDYKDNYIKYKFLTIDSNRVSSSIYSNRLDIMLEEYYPLNDISNYNESAQTLPYYE